jgi:hypothetical protein
LLNSYPADRVSKIRREFGKRGQDESSIRVSEMRNNQVCGVNLQVAVEEDVEIDGAWPAGVIPDAAGFAFNQKAGWSV